MRYAPIIAGIAILTISVFGYTYAGEQQTILGPAADILNQEGQNWSLIKSISAAGAVLGILLIAAGIIFNNMEPRGWLNQT